MNRHARTLGALVFTVIAALASSANAAWPDHPIKVLVPFPAGGQLDVVVRTIADRISPALGQPIVVETRTGADGNIAAEAVAKSAPDGYTWLSTSVPFTTQASLQPDRLRYDPLKADVLAKYRSMGVDPVEPHPPEAFGKLLSSEIARWGKVIREANVKVQ